MATNPGTAKNSAKFVKAKRPKEARRKNSMTPTTKGADYYKTSQAANKVIKKGHMTMPVDDLSKTVDRAISASRKWRANMDKAKKK